MSFLCTIGLVCLAFNFLAIATLCAVGLWYQTQIKMVGRLAVSLLQKKHTAPLDPNNRMTVNNHQEEDDEEELPPSPTFSMDKKEL